MKEGFDLIIWRPSAAREHVGEHVREYVTAHDTAHDAKYLFIENLAHRLVWVLDVEMSRAEIMKRLELRHRQNFLNSYLNPALEAGLIKMTIPESPKSKKQKYRLTAKGKKLKTKLEKNDFIKNK